ncbi:CKLF-like MARVEL transmembrane domain-containing protein 1 [Myotis daubentonii]|uniref:CKLF-like MARVEL transmembrane domain-containing protein 1 n=1 Tax=Myotis daubentonii TaxID=98922 RepID=UPI002873221B|nr:CKLF-like MARVEL transmembrane domain-containing protein 1 [Myotis daubentonii]
MYTSEAMGPEESASGRPGRSAPAKNQPKRSTPSVRSVHPGPKGKPAVPKKAPDQKPSEQAAPSEWEKAVIQKRAEGRTKVPPRFRDSIKRFFFSPTGALKIVRLDLINSFVTTVFLLVVAILTMQEKERRHLFYIGGCLCLSAAIVCLVDASLVTKMVRQAMKKALGLEGETTPSPAQAAATATATATAEAGEEPTQQPIPQPDKMLSPAASERPTGGPSLAKEAAATP